MVNARRGLPGIAAAFVGVGLAVLVAIAPAAAQQAAQSQRDRFMQTVFEVMDKDKSNFVSLAEFKAFGENEFKAADANKDGAISQAEFVNRRPNGKFTEQQIQQIRRQWTVQFDGLDGNGDGKVTTAEHGSVGDRAYRALDRDGSGSLTLEEMRAAVSATP